MTPASSNLLILAAGVAAGLIGGYLVGRRHGAGRIGGDETSQARAARWLANHRELDRALATCYAHWLRLENPFGVLVIRLEASGEARSAGDRPVPVDAVVRQLIDALRRGLREIDQLWATGDAELTVVLPATDLPQARAVARRAQPIIERVVRTCPDFAFTAGLAVIRAEDNVPMLLDAARAAARAARTTGPNQLGVRDGDQLRPITDLDDASLPSSPNTPPLADPPRAANLQQG